MAVLLLLTYAAVCVVLVKLLRVPVNRWSVTTGALGGVILVGGLLLTMDYDHPFTTDGRIYFYTTPIVPTVSGTVLEVAAAPNRPLKQGDLLFRIDPRPYQYAVDQRKAALAQAEQSVKQLRASLDGAMAEVQKAQAQLDLQQETHDRQAQLLAKQDISQAAMDTATRNLEAARYALDQRLAAAEVARLAYGAQVDGVNTAVAAARADLDSAAYDLSQTSVVAPTDGYVTQLFLKPGMTVGPGTPTLVFIHAGPQILGASFSQKVLQRIAAGDAAEVAFDGIPGRVFRAQVILVADAIAQGQVQPGGALLDPAALNQSRGRAVTRLQLVDDVSAYQLPPGSAAQVAVYTQHRPGLAVIRRILLRMKAWLNYLA